MRNPVRSVCAAIQSERMEMARLIDVDGRGRRGIMGFEAVIGWVRECRTDLLLEHGGVLVTQRGSYVDVGTWGSSVPGGTEYAIDVCEHLGITDSSSLVARLAATVTDVPVLMPEQGPPPRDFGCFTYEPVPEDWMIHDRPRIEECLRYQDGAGRGCWPEGGLPLVAKREPVQGETVWSSTLGENENQKLAHAFLKRWAPVTA